MLIGSLKDEYSTMDQFIETNIDTIYEMYLSAKQQTKSEQEDVDMSSVVLVAIALVNDDDKVEIPCRMSEKDEELVSALAIQLETPILLESMVERNLICRTKKDGINYYSLKE